MRTPSTPTAPALAARLALGLALAATVLAGCSSGGSDASPTTATTAKPTAGEAPESTTEATTGSTKDATTTSAAPLTALPPCQELLQQYADAFTLDDLDPATALFRQWAPLMPPDVGAAVTRLADAWDAVDGDATKLDFADRDLTADAQVFSDWTAAGCPSA